MKKAKKIRKVTKTELKNIKGGAAKPLKTFINR